MKKLTAMLLALVMALSLVACGQKADDNKTDDNGDTKTTLVVGTSADYAPFEFMYPDESGEMVYGGIDVSVAQYVADEMGLTLQVENMSFDNLLICFAPIERYSGDSGDVQQVSYISGGDAYYFSRGAVQHGRWEKASPEHPLLVYDKTGAQMLFNRGKTYLAIVDDDEWQNFNYQ